MQEEIDGQVLRGPVCLRNVAAIQRPGWLGIGSRRLSITGWWMPIAGTCAVGVSLGLPLFLLMRERELRRAVDRR